MKDRGEIGQNEITGREKESETKYGSIYQKQENLVIDLMWS